MTPAGSALRVPTILEALYDPALFEPLFRGSDWDAWRVCLAATFGLPLMASELEIYRACTGRTEAPTSPVKELWTIVGRRGGKSRIAALIAVYLACFRRYESLLAPGEVATVMVIGPDRRQARTVMRYIRGLLDAVPMLHTLVVRPLKAEEIRLREGRVAIEVHTASSVAVRGYTVVGAVLDELAFWPAEDSANPDLEIIEALLPAMATVPDALLVPITSPHARRGEAWRAYREHYGREGDSVLVWKAPTWVMHPRLTRDSRAITDAFDRDPARAGAEYGAEFRTDLEAFVSREIVEGAITAREAVRPRQDGKRYVAFVDPSGGSADSMTLAIAHRDGDQVVLDTLLEERPPFSPEAVVERFVDVLREYDVHAIVGDRYAGEWPRERFRKHGVDYVPAAKPKSEIYLAALPLLNSGRVQLLDLPRLTTQLISLERRVARGGRDSVDHAPGAHDDVANACAGALVLALDARASGEDIGIS